MSKLPYYFYIIYNLIYKLKIPIIPKIMVMINRIFWGVYIPASCTLGKGTKFGYGGSAVVIHARAVVGKNCLISPCVTIGGRSRIYDVPIIGDNVFIGGGAKILGNVKIGNNVVIGANAVVINDIPDNCIVAGIPAKIIKRNIQVEDYV